MIEKLLNFVIDGVVEPKAHKIQQETGHNNFDQARTLLWLCIIFETVRLATVHDSQTGWRAISIAGMAMVVLIIIHELESYSKSNVRAGLKNNLRYSLFYKIIFCLFTFFDLPTGTLCLLIFTVDPSWTGAYLTFVCYAKPAAVYLCACTPLPPKPKWLLVPAAQCASN